MADDLLLLRTGDYLLLRTGDRLILRVGAAAADVLPQTLQAIEEGVIASRGMHEIEEGFIA